MNIEELNELSDFDVNVRVADALKLNWSWSISAADEKIVMISCCYVFDPCNNWADAGPIIEKYGISLIFEKDQEPGAYSNFEIGMSGYDFNCDIGVGHKNPLRAAMMCFLMMRVKQ